MLGCCGLEAQDRGCDYCGGGKSWQVTGIQRGSPPCPAFLEASRGTLESARTVLSWPQSGILLSLPPDFLPLSTSTHRRNGLTGVKVSCFWGQVVALYIGLALRPMVWAIKNELGGVLIWCSLGASPSHRKLSTGQLRQVAHRRAGRERTSTPSILIMGLGCPQGVPF